MELIDKIKREINVKQEDFWSDREYLLYGKHTSLIKNEREDPNFSLKDEIIDLEEDICSEGYETKKRGKLARKKSQLKRLHNNIKQKNEGIVLKDLINSKFPLVRLERLNSENITSIDDESTLLTKTEYKTLKGDKITQQSSSLFKCYYCNIYFTHLNNLKRHSAIHLKKTRFKCSTCKYECHRIDLFNNHVSCHQKKVVQCFYCDFITSDKIYLERHLRKHESKDQPLKFDLYKCSECSFQTNYRTGIMLHHLNHSEKFWFNCPKCSYGCNSRITFLRHIPTHGTIKLYKCFKCSYRTNYLTHWRRHDLAHKRSEKYSKNLQEKLFKCSECNFCTNYKCALISHVHRHLKSESHESDINFKNQELAGEVDKSKMFNCKNFDFYSKTKKGVNVHKRIHKK